MTEQYIKKDGKIYLQRIDEQEVSLVELEQQKTFIQQEADERKARIQAEITKITSLK